MKRWVCFLFVTGLIFGACNATGPIYPVDDTLYDWVKAPGALDPRSDQAPAIADPVVSFALLPGDRRSALRVPEDFHMGQTYLLGFDVRLDPRALGTEQFTLSRFFRRGSQEVEIVAVHLAPDKGVTVFGRTCIPLEKLDDWHRVEMRIRLTDRDRGFLEVFCDRKPVWAQTKLRTTQPPVCRRSAGCVAPTPLPADFTWQIGLFSSSGAARTTTVQMQRLHYRTLFVVPGRSAPL